jgi:NADH-quinone oxidoreductase subunit F
MQAEATREERAAVDALLGPPPTQWVGAERSEGDGRVSRGGREARDDRHLLLPALHAVRDRVGWVSEGALNYICRRLTVPPAEAYGVASFYALFSLEPQPATVVHVCDDIACLARGAGALCDELARTLGAAAAHGSDGAAWARSPCLGLCDRAPAVLIQRAGPGAVDAALAPATAEAVAAAFGDPLGPAQAGLGERRAGAPDGAARSVPQAEDPRARHAGRPWPHARSRAYVRYPRTPH